MTLISAFVVGYGSTLLFIFASGLRCCMIAGIFCLGGGEEPSNILADRHSKNAASAEEAWSGGVCGADSLAVSGGPRGPPEDTCGIVT